MNQIFTKMLEQLGRSSPAKMTGAVKTFPLRELLKQSNQIQEGTGSSSSRSFR
jgi:hypothetical protein